MKFKQAKNWLMIVGLLFLVFPQASQASWFDNDAENAIAYYEGYNRAMAQLSVFQKTTTNTAVDTASVGDLEDEIKSLEAQINALSSQVDKLVINPDLDPDNYASFATYVTTPMRQDLDAAGYDIKDVGDLSIDRINSNTETVYFDSNVQIENGDLEVNDGNVYADEIHVGDALPGKITAYTNSSAGGAIRGTANGTYAKGGFFDASGSDAAAVYAIASSSSDAWAGWFKGSMMISGISSVVNDDYDPNRITLVVVAPDEPDKKTLSVSAQGYRALNSSFETEGNDSYSIYSVARGVNSYAVNAAVEGHHSVALSGRASFEDSYAGYFDGKVFVDGIIGIGTINPNKQLHIYSQYENAEIDIQSGQNTHWGIYQDSLSGNMLFWNQGNRVTFTDYGYVGIGTTTPAHTLDVEGYINADKSCIDGICIDDWEDLIDILGISTTTGAF